MGIMSVYRLHDMLKYRSIKNSVCGKVTITWKRLPDIPPLILRRMYLTDIKNYSRYCIKLIKPQISTNSIFKDNVESSISVNKTLNMVALNYDEFNIFSKRIIQK